MPSPHLPLPQLLRLSLIALLASLVSASALAQTVSGTIVDPTGEAVIGAAVLVVGTSRGTVTDIDGAYSLEAAPSDSLRITYVGYAPTTIAVGSRSTIDITLAEDVAALQDVVVVGYRSEQRRTTTGAVSTVDFSEVDELPVIGIDQALQGRAAGVQVTNSTGAPGADVSVRIRGVASVNGSSPLYVVDGVPIQGGLNQLAPGDIETLTILKDAAASIYGARAANGVVLITTKRGRSGTPVVSFDSYVGLQRVGNLPEMLNTAQFIELQNEAIRNTNVQRVERGQMPLPLNPDEPASLPDVDWLSSVFRTAPMQSHRVGVSGASDNVDYLVSGDYLDQQGILLNSGFDRYAFRVNTGIKVRPGLRIGTNFTASRTSQDRVGDSGDGLGGNGGGVIRYALLRPSAIPEFNEDGTRTDLPTAPMFYGDAYNPVTLLEKYDWTLNRERILGNVFAEWEAIKGLNFRTSFGVDRNTGREKRFNETYGDFDRINATNSLTVRESQESVLTWTTTAAFAKTLSDALDLDALAGVETISRQGGATFAASSDFPNQDANFRYLALGQSQRFVDEGAYASGLFSVFAQAKLGILDRYYITGTLRRDGSSRFGANNRFGYFPSVSVAWSLLDEPALERLQGNTLTSLKLRGSYGVLGNQEIGDYSFASLIGATQGYNFGNNIARGLTVAQLGNADLRWERNTQTNLGLDIGLLQGAFELSANAFQIETSDMLVAVPLSYIGGRISPPFVNAGSVRNRGLELEASVRGGEAMRWHIGVNAGIVRNEVLSLGSGLPILAGATGGQVGFLTRTEPGHPIGSFYLYEADGIFQTPAEVAAHAGTGPNGERALLQPEAVPGDIRFVDRNGDGKLDGDDRFHAGSPQPNLSYGLTGDISFRGFDVGMFWQGVEGNEIYQYQRRISEDASRPFNSYATLLDRWTGPGTSTTVPRVARVDLNDNLRNSTRFLEDGSYIRLKTVTLGYTFASGALSRHISGLRLYLSAFNLLTFTKYSGLDPELGTNDNDRGAGDLAVGIDWGTYPVARTFTFGLKATL